MAVIGTITIVTLLFFYLARTRWGTPLWMVVVGGGALLLVDALFLAANLTKLVHGAWLPLAIAITFFTVMMTWQRGREVVTARREEMEGPLQEFVDDLDSGAQVPAVVPGTAIFLNRGTTTPLALRANVEHNHVRHEHVIVLSIDTLPVPRLADDQRILVDHLGHAGDGITHVTARYGYMETPDVPALLRMLDAELTEGQISVDEASYFLSKLDLTRGKEKTMPGWRKRLFIGLAHNAASPVGSFRLPAHRTVVMGSNIDL
jgi:KUP system potassium uptake protein